MDWSYWLPEVVVYVLTLVCLRHAWKTGGLAWTATFLAGSLYGFALEYFSVTASHEYCYGEFLIMVPPGVCASPGAPPCPCLSQVPLWIMFGWGVTLYLAMRTSSHLDIPWYVRPLVDAMLAVNIDWILDPLAGTLGWWNWTHPGAWFGIPLNNFVGWIVTVIGFSFVLRLLQRLVPVGVTGTLRHVGLPVAAMLLGPIVVVVVMKGYPLLGISPAWMLGALVALCVLIILPQVPHVTRLLPPDWLLIGIPVFFQLWYAAGLWYFGVWAAHPLLVLVFLVTLTVAVLGYTWPYRFGAGGGP